MAQGGVLIVTWDGGGNVPPALALAERLTARGHRVRVSGPSSMAEAVAATGAQLAPYRSVRPLTAGLNHESNWPIIEAILNGPAMVDDLLAEHRADPIETLVVDSMSGAGLAVGEALRLPMAILVHTLYQPYRSWGPHVVNVREMRERVGLAAVEADGFPEILDRAAAVLALVPPGFDFPIDRLPANTTYVGPILSPSAPSAPTVPNRRRAGGDEPVVLITLGSTVQRQREALRPILEAIVGLPVRGLLTLGGVLPESEIEAPPNVEVRGHVPHASILLDVAAVVCHGGLSTITAALAAGKPLVVIPQGRDQDMNAERVEASGAGLALPIDAGVGQIAGAIRRVIEEARFGVAAREWAATIADLGAGAIATMIVEGLGSDGAAPGPAMRAAATTGTVASL
jgi:MGT family glycosyltransferase